MIRTDVHLTIWPGDAEPADVIGVLALQSTRVVVEDRMVRTGQVLEVGAVTLQFLKTRHDSDGAIHEMLATYEAGSPSPPTHLHPHQTETFHVEEGALRFVVDGIEHVVEPGGSIVVEPGQIHTVRNENHDRPAVARWRTEPALATGEFFEALALAGDDLEQVMDVVRRHTEEFRLV